MRLVVLMIFLVTHVIYAAESNPMIEKDVQKLESSIHESIVKLRHLRDKRRLRAEQQQEKQPVVVCCEPQAGLNNIPMAFRQAWGQRDYTRYPLNPYQTFLRVAVKDQPIDMELHAWLQGDQDIFYNTQGIYMDNGLISNPVINQNNVARYWLRRARPSIEGQAYGFLTYFLNVDFGFNNPSLYDAFVDLHYYRLLALQFGQQMSLVSGIENFFDNFDYLSRAYTMEVSHSAMLAPDRQIGLVAHGSFGPSGCEPYYPGLSMLGFDDMFSYQVGWLTDTGDNQNQRGQYNYQTDAVISENNLTDYAFEGRLFVNPFINKPGTLMHHLGLGLAGSLGSPSRQSNLPNLNSVGLNPIFIYGENAFSSTSGGYANLTANGRRSRLHPQMVWGYGPLGLLADWTQTTQTLGLFTDAGKLQQKLVQRNQANQISLIYNLTQEEFNLFHFIPNRPFKLLEKGCMGGLQMVFRLSGLQLDSNVFNDKRVDTTQGVSYTYYSFADPRISVQKANTWSLGLNWYWNRFIRWTTEYDYTSFVGGCSTGAGSNNCLTTADNIFSNTYLTSSQVINRPPEKIFMTRIQLQF